MGATWDGMGVNFSLFSEHATGVEVCLFDSVDALGSDPGRGAKSLVPPRFPRGSLRFIQCLIGDSVNIGQSALHFF